MYHPNQLDEQGVRKLLEGNGLVTLSLDAIRQDPGYDPIKNRFRPSVSGAVWIPEYERVNLPEKMRGEGVYAPNAVLIEGLGDFWPEREERTGIIAFEHSAHAFYALLRNGSTQLTRPRAVRPKMVVTARLDCLYLAEQERIKRLIDV